MALGLFTTGFTVTEVLLIQRKAKELLLEGKTVMTWADNGSSVSKQFPMTVKETLEECSYALRILDPKTYGPRRGVTQSSISGYLAK